MSIESIDPATREIALAFGGTAEAEETVMIAYGDKDYGTDFAAWPCRRQLGTVAADATGATFTIPTGWAVDPGGKYFRIFTGAATALPYDSEVEYIQGSGTAGSATCPYILTDVKPLCTDKVEFEIMPRTVSGNQSIFCARSGMSDNSTFTCFTIGSTFRFDRITSGAATSGTISTGKRYAATADYGTGAVNIKCDGADFFSKTMSITTFTVGGPLVLFSSYNTYTASTEEYATWNNGGTYNLYRFKLAAADGTVKLDLVPVIKNSVTYLYDKVSGNLLGKSGGSGAFGHGIAMSDGVKLAASGVSEAVFAGRTISLAAFDAETGAVSLKFSGVALSAQQTLVVAFGSKDCGEDLASWDANKRFPLGTVAADATSGTYTLPPLAIASGTFFRLFLVDSVTVDDYDEEVAWIQPETLGAYMNTGFVPSQNPKAEFKMNMDGKSYSDTWAYVLRANTGWPNHIQLGVNGDGQINNTRVGNITFKAVSTTADHVITLSYQYSDRSSNSIKIDGKTATPTTNWNNYNNNQVVKPANPLFLWSNHTGDGNFSAVKIYYMKWMNTSGTVQANFIPVKKDGEYCLYNKNNSTLIHNAGAEGTAFKGGAVVGYPGVTPSGGQSASAAKKSGTVGITEFDNSTFDATLAWPALPAASTLWVVFSGRSPGEDPGAFNLADWDECVKLDDIAAGSEGGTYNLGDPSGKKRSSMRFIIATAGSAAEDIVPLNVSRAYRFKKEGLSVYIR